MTMPAQKPGASRQDYGTPWPFIRAVEQKFGRLVFDLAASYTNKKAPDFYSQGDDALRQHWHKLKGLLWLNPPYGNIRPWVQKCAHESMLGANILLLVPAAVGANWFAEHVHDQAVVNFVRPRLVFEGCADPYPKDLILCFYSMGFRGYQTWKWNELSCAAGTGGRHTG